MNGNQSKKWVYMFLHKGLFTMILRQWNLSRNTDGHTSVIWHCYSQNRILKISIINSDAPDKE